MKISKNIVLLSVAIITLISLVAIATYSYFTASVNTNNKIITNVKMPMRSTFTVSGGGELTLTITRNLILKENVYNGTWIEDKSRLSSSKNLIITLTGEPGTLCTYNIYYKDISLNDSYVYMRTGSMWDFPFTLVRNGVTIIDWSDYILLSQSSVSKPKTTALFGGSTAPFNKAKPTITIPSGSILATDEWQFLIQFMNHNWDQSALADKTFKGELYVDDVSCT